MNKLQQKIDNELIHNFSIKLNNEDFDISKYAPGNKYWFYLVDKNTVSVIEAIINNVNITWCQSRGLIINIENSFPDHASEALYREYVCSVGIEDVFFSKEECLEEANKYIKSTKNKKLKIVEKVQPQRDIWEKSIKEWNTKNSYEETKSNDDLIELNINEMML